MSEERVNRVLADAEKFAGTRPGEIMSRQLPELEGDELVFAWEPDGPPDNLKQQPVVIRCGEHTVWRAVTPPASATRFVDVAAVLARRYGKRARDLVPTDEARAYLVGTNTFNDELINGARARLREGWQVGNAK